MYQLISRNGVRLDVPTELSELSGDYLSRCCSDVNIAQNYGIVAVVCKCSLKTILSVKDADNRVTAVPVLIRKFDNDNKFTHLNNRAKLIIGRSEVERGHQYDSEHNELTVANIKNFIISDDKLRCELIDGKVFKDPVSQSLINTIQKPILGADGLAVDKNFHKIDLKAATDTEVLFVSFKVVALVDIIGCYNGTILGANTVTNYTIDLSNADTTDIAN